jgi:hypothetical protein
MFSLTLLSFSPLSRETNVIAIVLGVLAFILDTIVIPNATVTSSCATAIVAGACWHVYKVFDGLSYDGAETVYGSFIGLAAVFAICRLYFLI